MKLLGTPNYEDLISDKIPERRFKLVYPNKEVFYLTDEERDYFVNLVNQGQKFIQIGEYTFTSSFTILYPIKNKLVKKDYEEIKPGVMREI